MHLELRETNENLLDNIMGKANNVLKFTKNQEICLLHFFKKVKKFGAYQTTPREEARPVEQKWVLCCKFCSQARRSSSPDFQKKTSKFVFFLKGL